MRADGTTRRTLLTGLGGVAASACLLPGIARGEVPTGVLPPIGGSDAAGALGSGIASIRADRVLVLKRDRLLHLYRGDEIQRTFRVALGRQPEGHKLREGDGRTPEGRYRLESFKPDSAFYRAIRISYPNEEDRQRARSLGVRPGGLIMLHGLDPAIGRKWQDAHWMFNWTRGCIAVTNHEMDVIWNSVDAGTPIDIRP